MLIRRESALGDFRKSFQPEREMNKLCIFVYVKMSCMFRPYLLRVNKTFKIMGLFKICHTTKIQIQIQSSKVTILVASIHLSIDLGVGNFYRPQQQQLRKIEM